MIKNRIKKNKTLSGVKPFKKLNKVFQDSLESDTCRTEEQGSETDASLDLLYPDHAIKNKINNDEYAKLLKVEMNLAASSVEATQEITQFKRLLVQHIENRILNSQKHFEERIQEELELLEESVNTTLTNLRDEHYYMHKVNKKNPRIPHMEKIFKYKSSLLSDMFKQTDYKTLYHMIVASSFILLINLLTQDYVQKGILFDIDSFLLIFTGLPQALQTLTIIIPWGYLSILLVSLYKNYRPPFALIVCLYFLLQFFQIAIPSYLCMTQDFGFATKTILMCEGARMGMKNHSYIRNKLLYGTENTFKNFIPLSLSQKGLLKPKLPEITIGVLKFEIRRYSYFVLAPTLIYRDYYLKAPHRNKKAIFIEFSNFFLSIFLGFIIFKTFCKDPIIQLRDNLTTSGFILVIFKLMLPAVMSLILLFFGFMHSWLNGWAELLRFPDRTFYLDWWTSSEFGQYYRKWNIVVHEFLFYYVYLDIQKLSKGRLGKKLGQFLTFFISAIIHEIVLYFALGFFYPVCFILFTGPGILLIRTGQQLFKHQWVNIIFWVLIYIGTSLMITLYLVEVYAREIITDQFIYDKYGIFSPMVPRTLHLSSLLNFS